MPQPNLNSSDYYSILGCTKSSTPAELKKAYRKLAVKWHPDKNPDNETATQNFQKISEAYNILSDEKKRKLYDQYGKQGVDAADHMPDGAGGGGGMGGFPAGMHFGGMPGGGAGGGGGGMHMSPEQAQAMFAEMFGGSDPFGGMMFGNMGGSGGMGGMGGMPGMTFSVGGMPGAGGMRGSMGGMDPFASMFSGGMGGMPGMNMNNMRQSPPQPKSYDTIPNGTVVSLKNLISQPERNGDQGKILQYNPSKQRYIIFFEDSDETIAVKASNLLQHVHVKIHDIASQPELNGKTGTILTWLDSKERYNIHVSALKKVVSLKPGNVVLEKGTVGQITGLSSKPELNGKFGTIVDWIRDSNKYDVQVSPSQVIRIKVENMRV